MSRRGSTRLNLVSKNRVACLVNWISTIGSHVWACFPRRSGARIGLDPLDDVRVGLRLPECAWAEFQVNFSNIYGTCLCAVNLMRGPLCTCWTRVVELIWCELGP
jgi:hypothetical protein